MSALKNYGTRTLVGNWFEERVTLNAHYANQNKPVPPTREMTVDIHVKAFQENPKMRMEDPFQKQSSYAIDTAIGRLNDRADIQKRIQTATRRQRLDGTVSMSRSAMPGSTFTPTMLGRQFHDPQKTRYNTVYRKSYNQPDFETIRTQRIATQQAGRAEGPKIKATDSTWKPNWNPE